MFYILSLPPNLARTIVVACPASPLANLLCSNRPAVLATLAIGVVLNAFCPTSAAVERLWLDEATEGVSGARRRDAADAILEMEVRDAIVEGGGEGGEVVMVVGMIRLTKD